MHTRMTSVRSIPSSFDSSSGVRWLAILPPPRVSKSPPALLHGGLADCSFSLLGRNQGTCLPELFIFRRIIALGDGRKENGCAGEAAASSRGRHCKQRLSGAARVRGGIRGRDALPRRGRG